MAQPNCLTPSETDDRAVTGLKRSIPCSAIFNFRDYGGYAVSGGGRIRSGLLFRSGRHLDATPADLDQVAALSLKTVIDLRGTKEREGAACPRPAGFAAEVLTVDGETAEAIAPHLHAASQARTAQAISDLFLKLYARMITLPHLIDICGRYFTRLSEADGASLIHCHTGKDRTGVVVAMLHRLLGVHPDDMLADYMLTNEVLVADMPKAVKDLQHHVPALDDERARMVLTVHPDYLAAAFDAIDREYGSFEKLVSERMGFNERRAEALRARLII